MVQYLRRHEHKAKGVHGAGQRGNCPRVPRVVLLEHQRPQGEAHHQRQQQHRHVVHLLGAVRRQSSSAQRVIKGRVKGMKE